MIVEWWDAMRPTPFQKFSPLPTVQFIYIFYFGEMRELGHRKLIYSRLWLIRLQHLQFYASPWATPLISYLVPEKFPPQKHILWPPHCLPLSIFINMNSRGLVKIYDSAFDSLPLDPLKRTLCHSFINISRKAMLESENIPGHVDKNRLDFFESLLWLHSFLSGTNEPLKRFFQLNGKSSSRNTIYPFYWIVERAQKLP